MKPKLKIHYKVFERYSKLEDLEIASGCDGETYYSVRKEGEYLIIEVS